MSSFGPMGGRGRQQLPTPPRGNTIARYETYADAQRAVDYLSDNEFPVQYVTIVGTGLRMVERVTGRLTYGRVAAAGLFSGAMFGLFLGLLLSLFSDGAGAVIAAGLAFGACFGMLSAIFSYAMTRGQRDFASTSQIVATEYEVLCLAEHATAATEVLHRLPGGTGRDPSPKPEPAPEPVTGPVTGPTYGEMIDKQRREREERERAAREHGSG